MTAWCEAGGVITFTCINDAIDRNERKASIKPFITVETGTLTSCTTFLRDRRKESKKHDWTGSQELDE